MNISSSIKETARQVLKESITRRYETGYIASIIVDLGTLSKANEGYSELLSLSHKFRKIQSNMMNDDFRHVDLVDGRTVATYEHFFSSNSNILLSTLSENGYNHALSAMRIAIREGLDNLGVPGDVTALEALKSLNMNATDIPEKWSKAQWKKALRFLNKLDERAARISRSIEDHEAFVCSKSRLSYLVNVEALDDNTLAAIAYLTSRANRRTLFNVTAQSKAFDFIHEGLISNLGDDANWFELAKVYPVGYVFARLTDGEKAELLNIYYEHMHSYGTYLGELYSEMPDLSKELFITDLGCDSSRWNAYAGAYNNMRSAWVGMIHSLGLDEVFRTFLPGKAERIVAKDIYMLRDRGNEESLKGHELFSLFPKPWEVLAGDAILDYDEAAKYAGWAAPLRDIETETPEIEPALLHGIIIENPAMVSILKKLGSYAGPSKAKNPFA